MSNLVDINNGVLTTTSKIVADAFGKAHRKVCRDIENLDCSKEFSTANFGLSEYTTERGKTYKCYNITRDGFSFLCMGFTGKKAAEWKEKYILAFNEMEKGLLSIDARMMEISRKLDQVKCDGQKWSELGREINKQKKAALLESQGLINDVQLKLEY